MNTSKTELQSRNNVRHLFGIRVSLLQLLLCFAIAIAGIAFAIQWIQSTAYFSGRIELWTNSPNDVAIEIGVMIIIYAASCAVARIDLETVSFIQS